VDQAEEGLQTEQVMAFQQLVVLSAIAAIVATDVTPVEKVIIMLEDMQTQVVNEGKAEAKTYDKFACFCKDMTNEKTDAITAGQDEQATLTADIEKLSTRRAELDETIAGLEKKISEIEEAMKQAQDQRAEELALYEKNAADMNAALVALEEAIKALKASKPASLAEMRSVVRTVRKAVLMADALGLGGPKAVRAVTALLQQPEVPMQDYDFHSGEIIEMLEKLLGDFQNTKKEVDEAEVKSVSAFDRLMQSLTSEKKDAENDLDKAKKSRGETIAEISQKSQDLSIVSATLLDDQEYLKELASICESKAKSWDQRSKCRADELSALTEAVSIIKGTVSAKTTSNTIRFVQRHATVGGAIAVATSEDAMEAIEAGAEADEEDNAAVAFLQLRQPRALLSALSTGVQEPTLDVEQSKRAQVLALLRSESKTLKSTLLASLVSQVAADPFAKVKKLIQELIERLLQEAADEGEHKGWCDTATGKAKQQRKFKSEEVATLNSRLASNEALRDKLSEQIDVLDKEIKELEDELAKATKMRADEKAENEATIKEAGEGKEAVQMAIDVLSKFYKTAAKATVLAQGPADDMPDAGFEGAYKGKQAESGGILGMLDVILSDFDRTIRETTKAESEAAREFLEFERESKVSLKTKNVARDDLNEQLTKTLDRLAEDMSSMLDNQDLLNKAIQELEELHAACVDTGMSYAERVAMREQEMEALKKALCILDTMGPVQTEGC